MATGELVSTRQCPDCGETKPETIEHYYSRKAGGWERVCRECRKRIARERHHAISEAEWKQRAGFRLTAHELKLVELAVNRRKSRRKYQARIKRENPEAYRKWQREYRERNAEAFRDRARMEYWMREGERERIKQPSKQNTRYQASLNHSEDAFSPEPIARWIEETFGGRATAILEAPIYLGMNERTVRKILDRDGRVTIRTVDKALVTFGRPDLLNELYPIEATA